MPGTVPFGFHEGSRSEYLAQYVFASWGTAVAIPHQEDHGLDPCCTIMDRVGQLARARSTYTVQVKSGMQPWVFEGEGVRWLINHPLPLYLCVVDKSSARLSIYHTLPRFYTWALGTTPDRLELIPAPATGQPGQCTQWMGSYRFSLDQPILDFTINDFLEDTFRENARNVLDSWLNVENANLISVRAGLLKAKLPHPYRTNEAVRDASMEMWATEADHDQVDKAVAHLTECLTWLGGQLRQKGDWAGAAKAALLHRHLAPDRDGGAWSFVHTELNRLLNAEASHYLFAGTDKLAKQIDAALNPGMAKRD